MHKRGLDSHCSLAYKKGQIRHPQRITAPMPPTYERLKALGLNYDPERGLVSHTANYDYGLSTRAILSERYQIDGVRVAVARIAMMLHLKRTLESHERVLQYNGNKKDHRIGNLYVKDLL